MPDVLTLSVLHAGTKEVTVMRSLLNLAVGESQWQVIDQPGGDFTIVDIDSSEGTKCWQALTDDGHEVIALTRDRNCSARLKLNKPLRSRQFLDLLAGLTESESSLMIEAEMVNVQPRWESLELTDSEGMLTLAEHLRRGTWRSPVMLIVHGWPELVIDPGSGSWFYDGAVSDMTPAMFAEAIPAYCVLPLGSEELVTRTLNMNQRSLSELKWFAGLAQSRGKLHPDLAGDYQFMLTQVPSYAVDNERFKSLSQVLIRAPITIDELHEQSGEAVETVTSFLNACYTTGRLLVNQRVRAVSF
jgi:hypothetical protein